MGWDDWILSVAFCLGADADHLDAGFFKPLYDQGLDVQDAVDRWNSK